MVTLGSVSTVLRIVWRRLSPNYPVLPVGKGHMQYSVLLTVQRQFGSYTRAVVQSYSMKESGSGSLERGLGFMTDVVMYLYKLIISFITWDCSVTKIFEPIQTTP